MRLKLYQATSPQAAMALIRAELGDEALILSTRKVVGGVEIAAAREDVPTHAPIPVNPATAHCLAFHGVPELLADRLSRGDLAETLDSVLRFTPLPLAAGELPLMFAGPPGAGKTLTVARLATRLVMEGQKPMVITADGRRAGAAEQLAAFTRLLGLDLVVASQPVSLARALARRREGEPVLIDLPGISPFDALQSAELATLAAAAQAQVALVLPAGMDQMEARETADGFAALGAAFLIATRLDVARRLGCVLAAAEAGLALAEAGVGPGAADGMVPMRPRMLASLLTDSAQRAGGRQ